ncbi:guanitoxin biosynthesis heme-dependent pre-guanitoxin N-hydroxylase GntA [Rhodopseudomonas palustris]|uniref:guanitoxin biosynthesis heme-dependent pre-guanitoxin N-hydroxylase GntA n=1 Tax=Rhodopseudomonas palustris TaxID=1076 RepID=UPI002ACEFCBA|nr:guanitoxin biosynthesis heme-dependent pre-guanitoxin N-hydroxylase GntA [Rhodopseudomonas palustris]WQH01913.1 guanitoxin biosynthesis heme-dependent pre-guanitoxin N-hydroxylase GntA [Rhodopseudomonas palustris]
MTPPSLEDEFRSFIHAADFPCVGAKSALAKGTLHVLVARDLRSNWDDRRIYDGITRVVRGYRADRALFQSFAVIFEGPTDIDERIFEKFLWARAESLTNKDTWLGRPHDERVSSDPGDPHFSLSFGEEAFFIVGLHPNASRPARRFERPVLVFNLHDQFEQLREMGRYERLRAKIIERDVALAGSPNPMLARHGETSEARQYSGRVVAEQEWVCPFNPVERV